MAGIVVRNLSDCCPIGVRLPPDRCPIAVRFHHENASDSARCATGVASEVGGFSGARRHRRLSRPPRPGTTDGVRTLSMAEIAAKVADATPSDTSIRQLAPLMLARMSPERTLTPAATKKQPPLARLKNLSSRPAKRWRKGPWLKVV